MRDFLVLTPACDGMDGISELSRQVVEVFVRAVGVDHVEVWTLTGEAPPLEEGETGLRFRTAQGSRSRLVGWALARGATPLRDVTIIVTHVHLAPVAGVMALRGAHVTVLLIGWEVWRKLRPRERHVLKRADRLIAISEYTLRRFREANPDVWSGPVALCPLGIGPGRIHPLPSEAGVEGGFALIVSRLWSQERYKGHDWLIDIWPAVRRRVHDARLLAVGDGDDRLRLEARVKALGLDDAIHFTGRIDDERLEALYRASAFFVMPSTNEGFGLVYLEAMREGKPCIALHGAADEIIVDGETGFLVGRGQSSDLVDAVVRLFLDQELRSRMGEAAAAHVARQFTSEHFADRFRTALGLSAQPPGAGMSPRPTGDLDAACGPNQVLRFSSAPDPDVPT